MSSLLSSSRTLLLAVGIAVSSPASAVGGIAPHAFSADIRSEDLAAHLATLASDAFAGRAPDTPGEQRTVEYLRAQFEAMGLQPGNGRDWFQDVPVIASTVDPARSRMSFAVAGATQALVFGDDVVYSTGTAQPELRLTGSAIVFAGYGIDAPELDWHDYAGIDVVGKTVVVLAGAPPEFPAGSWYGRSTCKLEEAARQGAVAAILVHDERAAGIGWQVLRARARAAQFDLPYGDDPRPPPPVRAWLAANAAARLLDAAGVPLGTLRKRAAQRGFRALALDGASMSVVIAGSAVAARSRNVVASVPGTRHADEAIVYSAHWDHLGTHADAKGDGIHNGALDNAIGVAALLELAGRFAKAVPPPERSIVFLAPTLEEAGLLGSKYYTLHPVVPASQTVIDINFDVMVPAGPTRNVVVVGLGQSTVDDWLRPLAQRQARTPEAEGRDSVDAFFRSDHLNFARVGVPVLYLRGGTQGRAGRDPYAAWNAFGQRYHTPADEFDPHWDLRGVVQDVELAYELGARLAAGRDWPNWHAGTPFRAIRDASRAPAIVGQR